MKLVWFGRRDVALRVTFRADPSFELELGGEAAPALGQRCQTCTMAVTSLDTGFVLTPSSGVVHAECVDDELVVLLGQKNDGELQEGEAVPYDPGAQLVMAGRLVSLALVSQERERKVTVAALKLRSLMIELGRECDAYVVLVKGKTDDDERVEIASQKLWRLVDAGKRFSELAVARNGEVFGKPAKAGGV